jgi:ABC-type sugar transport system substrate-binding protein
MRKTKVVAMILVVVFTMAMFIGCSSPTPQTSSSVNEEMTTTTENTGETIQAGDNGESPAVTEEKETYVWIASLSTLPLFLAHDYPALKEEAERLGVNIEFAGPATVDIEAQNTILEQWIAKKPAGILFMPFGEGHNEIINKAIAEGIPVVCIDGDAPNSDRVAFVGTGWEDLGRKQARIMGELLGGKGKVMLSAVIPNDNTNLAVKGYEEVMAKDYPDIEIIGINNDKGDVTEAANLAAQTIQANPDIAGFSGIDAASGPGIAVAIREAGKVGDIKVTCVDDTPDILQAIEEGIIDATVAQKREAFETFALRTLYYYNHPGYSIGEKFAEAGFNMIPSLMYTGTTVITKDNLDMLSEVYAYEAEVADKLK